MCQDHKTVLHNRRWCRMICLFIVVVCSAIFCTAVWAHKVTIFAWVEGDTVYTQSKFSGGKKAKNATVVVFDLEENQLLEGKTDENGEFSFKIPQKTALRVVLKASMGHQGEWIIPAEEVGGDSGAPSVVDDPVKAPPVENNHNEVQAVVQGTLAQPVAGVSREEISTLVETLLDKKLAPIKSMLLESQGGHNMMDKIVSGVGYIFGLVGVAFYFSARGGKK